MAADEELVAELAQAMHAALDAPGCSCSPAARLMFEICATAVEQWLSERGRLVPGGDCLVDETWGVKVGGTFAQVAPFRRRVDAETEIENCRANGFTARRSLVRRESRRWPDGTVITTPWVAVQPKPEEMPDA